MPVQTDFLDEEIRRKLGQISDMLVTVARNLVQLQGLVDDRRTVRDGSTPAMIDGDPRAD